MIVLNEPELKIARHALGLDNPDCRRKSYRNRYFCGPKAPAFWIWRGLVKRSLAGMVEDRPAGLIGPPHPRSARCFYLLRIAAVAALRKGESLCPEDFPLDASGQMGGWGV